MIRCFILNYGIGGNGVVNTYLRDTSNSSGFGYQAPLNIDDSDTKETIRSRVESNITAQCEIDVVTPPDEFIWLMDTPAIVKSFTNPSRSLDSAFQISTSNDALVAYTVQVVSNLSLTGGQVGSVILEYADNSGMSTNVVTVSEMGGGNTGTLTIGLNTNDTTKTSLTGVVPSGKYVRLRTVDTTGTPVQTIVSAQEVLL